MNKKEKWFVEGEYGGMFSNLRDVRNCAKYCSTTREHEYKSRVYDYQNWIGYIDYENGKCVRDGWTVKK
jgi:hypothetical protein